MLVIVQNGKLDRAGIRIIALSISVYRKSILKIIALIISGKVTPEPNRMPPKRKIVTGSLEKLSRKEPPF